mgnify:CR=1 FL=1
MGHEIAHAFARHGVESLTRYSVLQLGTLAISQNNKAKNLLNKCFLEIAHKKLIRVTN